jgi:hypothetical protein
MVATACAYADDYKAIRAPTCGCDVCEQKWETAKREQERHADTLAAASVLTSQSPGAKRWRARRPASWVNR